jgi:hypothetical protein
VLNKIARSVVESAIVEHDKSVFTDNDNRMWDGMRPLI